MTKVDKELARGVEQCLSLSIQGKIPQSIEAGKRLQRRFPQRGSAYLGVLLAELINGNERAVAKSLSICFNLKADAYSSLIYQSLAWYFKFKFDEAITTALSAHQLRPELPFALVLISFIQIRMERHSEAFYNLTSALDRFSAPPELKLQRLRCLEKIEATKASAPLRKGVFDYLAEPMLAPDRIAKLIASLIIKELENEPTDAGVLPIESILSNQLLMATLHKVVFCSPILEMLLIKVRQYLLVQLYQAGDQALGLHELAIKLAIQCFSNEFIYDETTDEEILVTELLNTVEATLAGSVSIDVDTLVSHLVALALYRPLHVVHGIERLSVEHKSLLGELLRITVDNPRVEQSIANVIPSAGSIDDKVSLNVKAQYEENPYPRWTSLERTVASKSYFEQASEEFRFRGGRTPDAKTPTSVLVAGCGTGRHAIWVASRYRDIEVTAIDISRTSLAYAQRMAKELQVSNVVFIECDILSVAALGRRFEVIESIGTLHHMESPSKGLGALVRALEPGGILRIGLYSEQARQRVAEIRNRFTKDLTTHFELSTFRHVRNEIMQKMTGGDGVINSSDFYTVSGCRDLLCHVQEHRLTITDLSQLLAENDLKFNGFSFYSNIGRTLYRNRYPDDSEMLNLDRWREIELETPELFSEMYIFYAQRAGLDSILPPG